MFYSVIVHYVQFIEHNERYGLEKKIYFLPHHPEKEFIITLLNVFTFMYKTHKNTETAYICIVFKDLLLFYL